jgi:glucosamine--fructose-6-phosphate aminotransferase (isomerizing)
VAAEIGSLGDNVAFLREQAASDRLLRALADIPHQSMSISSHTRWASVGAISEPNCHPVDNRLIPPNLEEAVQDAPIIHVCLNGDIDNYMDLKREAERKGDRIPEEITTDTKIIPIQVERYIKQGFQVKDAFRLALNDFHGSHAIAMQTDLAPGKLFLGQRGSGQAIFVGLGEDHYTVASEVYGFVEETPIYLKLDGEKVVDGKDGPVQGQIFVLDGDSAGGTGGIEAFYYDGTPMPMDGREIKQTAITSRDIDRQGFDHYFLKEITESPVSVEKTLLNRWKVTETGDGVQRYAVTLDESVIPPHLAEVLKSGIRRVFFVGQGTAGVAAQACADILEYYMDDPGLQVKSLKASELSGFKLGEEGDPKGMSDALVVAISQSGTTTDTNRTVDMVRARGAHTLAIVNRRDSDITFKVDGVIYTSSGRDIEMSVASTKAFYSQIVAGAILSLYIARLTDRRDDIFVAREIKRLLDLPAQMRKILDMREEIGRCADLTAITRTYWAVVGSGPNKTSADEIRIKLSELCYKTISTDYVEDKKHIDLSSEPLIIVCAAGTRPTVIGDIIKDTAIFRAHKALPIVIADEGENRFAPYAEQVFHVPAVGEHLSPIVNTLVGHIWGYYAALAINQGSRFLYHFRNEIGEEVDTCLREGGDLYEIILEKPFREKVAMFYRTFRRKKTERRIPSILGFDVSSDLTLLLKYLSGRLPASDFELDFGVKGTAIHMVNTLFTCLGEAINVMSRPVDAIKHQAKTVTVGTSRITEKMEGLLFDLLKEHHFKVSQLTPNNVMVLRNLQAIISEVKGLTLYRIGGLSLLGEPTEETTIKVVKKEGTSEGISSRVEADQRLKGTKRIIVRQGNVYIGKGRKDERSIVFIPVISESPATPNTIEYLLLLHIGFKETISLPDKVRALGGKYEHIKNLVQENSIAWKDDLLERVETSFLFGRSAEKISEAIVSEVNNQ